MSLFEEVMMGGQGDGGNLPTNQMSKMRLALLLAALFEDGQKEEPAPEVRVVTRAQPLP